MARITRRETLMRERHTTYIPWGDSAHPQSNRCLATGGSEKTGREQQRAQTPLARTRCHGKSESAPHSWKMSAAMRAPRYEVECGRRELDD